LPEGADFKQNSGMAKKKICWALFVLLLPAVPAACSWGEPETTAEPGVKSEESSPPPEAVEEAGSGEAAVPVKEAAGEAAIATEKPASETTIKADQPKAPPLDKKETVKKEPERNLLLTPTTQYEKSPAEFNVRFETTKGDFTVKLVREWSPIGVDHFYHLVKIGYFNDIAFFRAIEGFMVQFGMHGDPEINRLWSETNLQDEPVKASNLRGYMSFAKSSAPNSRSTQLFINLVDNTNLDGYGFSPIGQVIDGMSVVDSLYMGYGEGAPRGRGPSQMLISQQGNPYLKEKFPKLDYIKKTTILD